MKPHLLLILMVLLGLSSASPAIAEDDVVEQAVALIEKKEHKQAFKLMREAATDELMQQPRFMLTFADAARLYAPDVPMLNGGDRMRIEYFKGAGGLYQQVLANKDADELFQTKARQGLLRLKQALRDEADASRKDGFLEQLHRVGEAMAELWPKASEGPMLIFEAGQTAKDQPTQLKALRMLVAAKIKDPAIYSLASKFEVGYGGEIVVEGGGGYEAALKHLDAGLALFPDDVGLLDEKIRKLFEMKRLDEARKTLTVFEKAGEKVEDEKRRATTVGLAAWFYQRLGEADQAEKRYLKALEILPDNLPFRLDLGSLYFARATKRINELLDIPLEQEEKRDALNAAAKKDLALARVQLEYAHTHGEPSLDTMRTLREIYIQLQDTEAWQAMQRDIKKLERGEPIR